jgi:hypothetical protein
MSIIYKLVGIKSGDNVKNEIIHKDWDVQKNEINIQDVYSLFSTLGCTENINEIKFIINSETMKDEKSYSIFHSMDTDGKSHEYNLIIHVFTINEELKNKLITIFDTHGYVAKKEVIQTNVIQTNVNPKRPNIELSKPIPEDEIKINEETIINSNKETISLFSNKDFQTLIRIYYENSDVFKTFASYISTGNAVDASHFSNTRDVRFDDEFQEIKSLNLNIDDEIIQNTLKRFNGHINLTLRYILTTRSIESND